MARPLRIICPGAWYHITARGNERRAIFRDDRDRIHFLENLAEMAQRFDVRVHAFVLMGNHYHLLIEPRRLNLSQAVQWLNVSYSVWFNRRHARSGHLFQGRFKSVVVEPAMWGLGLSAYIHLNPVRVGALKLGKKERRGARQGPVESPGATLVQERLQTLRQYRWSSYRAYVGSAKQPEWLETAEVLALGGGLKREQAANYRKYVETQVRQGLADDPWSELTDGVLLGGAELLRRARGLLRKSYSAPRALRSIRQPLSFQEVVVAVEKTRGERWEDFRDRHSHGGRDQALYLARRVTALSLAELARQAGLNQHASVAMALKRYEKRLSTSAAERKLLKAVDELLQITM